MPTETRPTTPPIETGTLAVATRDSAVCRAGEVGVCVEVYALGGRPGWTFLFQGGGFDGFSADDVALFLEVQPAWDPEAAAYAFHSAGRLRADYRRGRFRRALGPPA